MVLTTLARLWEGGVTVGTELEGVRVDCEQHPPGSVEAQLSKKEMTKDRSRHSEEERTQALHRWIKNLKEIS